MRITSIKQQVKRTDRYSIYIDGKYAFSLSESELLAQGLASGKELSKEQVEDLKKVSGADKAYGNALRFVAMRPRSEWELHSYLRRKEVEEPVADDIMRRLRSVGLLDDLAFALSWVNSRRLLKNVSKRRLVLELKQKHIAEDITAQVLGEDQTSERDVLLELVQKKRSRYADQTKLMQYLARQGFSYDDIKSVLSQEDA